VRLGTEWAVHRDADVQAFHDKQLRVAYRARPQAASVMLDGGCLQTRAEGAGTGVTDPQWREFKAASLENLRSDVRTTDPQPEPPRRYRDREQVTRLATELKAARGAATTRGGVTARPARRVRRRRRQGSRPRKVVRTVVATMADSERFGWQVAAEVQRRGLHKAARKACVCDGQKYNWSIWQLHLVMLGFVPILDFLHLLVYLYAAASAAEGKGSAVAWALYETWLKQAWSGQVGVLLRGLRAVGNRLWNRPPGEGGRPAPGGVGGDRVRGRQPRQDALPGISPAGAADQQRPAGERDQATEPAGEGNGEVLEGGRSGSAAAGAGRLSQRG
jgi:hypothetical protein